MGDRAWIGITFYEVPDKDREDVFGFLEEHVYGFTDDEIILGEQYTADEHSLGFCSEDVVDLVNNHPGIVVEAHQANRYEFNGEVLMNTPELGTFLAEEDGGGEIILKDRLVDDVYGKLPDDASAKDLKDAIDREAGLPWLTHFRELEERFKSPRLTTITRPSEEEDEPEGPEHRFKFTVNIDGGNAAFEEYPAEEIARILRGLAEEIHDKWWTNNKEAMLFDINGNTVGHWTYTFPGGES